MKRKYFALFITALVAFSIPCNAQGWVKAGKAVSKQAVKALSKNSSKSTKTITKGATQNTSRNVNGNYNAAMSAAVANQYTTVKCFSCLGKGWYLYNGYKYQCSSCSGYGYKVIMK